VLVELHWPGPDTGEGALFGLMRGFHAWGFRVFHREPNVANVQRCWEFAMAKVFFALLHSCAYSLVCLLFYNIFAVPFASLQPLVGCILAQVSRIPWVFGVDIIIPAVSSNLTHLPSYLSLFVRLRPSTKTERLWFARFKGRRLWVVEVLQAVHV